MSGTARLTVNGRTFAARPGITLLEAAQAGGVAMPQDCRSGLCGTCRCQVVSGSVDDAGTLEGSSVLACQARVTGTAELRFDPVPQEMKASGEVSAVRPLGGEMIEVVLRVNRNVPYLPGQYIKVQFAGFPERDYSPTLTLDGLRGLDEIVLHIRQLENGAVSSALGTRIVPGTRFRLRGPFGHAFLRQGEGRLVLISSGAGFAPLWSMAVAARLGQPWREVVLLASARDPQNLYMRPALDWLMRQGVSAITLCTSGASPLPPARFGRATQFLPDVRGEDTVYACGAPEMVAAVRELARTAGATCYANPFHAAPDTNEPLGRKLINFIRRKPHSPVHARIEALEKGLAKPLD